MDNNKIERILIKLIDFKNDLMNDDNLRDIADMEVIEDRVDEDVIEKMSEQEFFAKNTSIADVALNNLVIENDEGLWMDSYPEYFEFSLWIEKMFDHQSTTRLPISSNGDKINGDDELLESVARNLWYVLEFSDGLAYINDFKEKCRYGLAEISLKINEYLGDGNIRIETDFEKISKMHFVDELVGIKTKINELETAIKNNDVNYHLNLEDREILFLERLFPSQIFIEINKDLDISDEILKEVKEMIFLSLEMQENQNPENFQHLRELKLIKDIKKIDKEKITKVNKKI